MTEVEELGSDRDDMVIRNLELHEFNKVEILNPFGDIRQEKKQGDKIVWK